jgi:hypothetical protein
MPREEISKPFPPATEFTNDAAGGAHQYGASGSVKPDSETVIRADLKSLAGQPAEHIMTPSVTPNLKESRICAKTQETEMTPGLRTALSNGRQLAIACIGTLKPVLGPKWCSAWPAAGFSDCALAVPTNPMVLLLQLRAYYAANPTREVANVRGIAFTATACEAAMQAIRRHRRWTGPSPRSACRTGSISR